MNTILMNAETAAQDVKVVATQKLTQDAIRDLLETELFMVGGGSGDVILG